MKSSNFINNGYIPSLDGLRAFSILLVIFAHLSFNFSNPLLSQLHFGSFGVSIFFVISGFLITTLLLKEKAKYGNIDLKNFYTRRILRIIPVAYIYLLTLLILKTFVFPKMDVGNPLRAMVFSENLAGHPTYTASSHYWSLSTEEQFYLIIPFVLTKKRLVFFKVCLFLFIVTPFAIYARYHIETSSTIINYFLFLLGGVLGTGMLTILVGCITAVLVFYYHDKMKFKLKNAVLIQVGLLILGWVFNFLYLPVGINENISAVFIAILILSVIYNTDNIIFKILNLRLVKYIGVLSYSLYIWQEIFCFKQPWENSIFPGKSILVNVLFLMITAMASYHLYEKKFLRLKDKFHKNNGCKKQYNKSLA